MPDSAELDSRLNALDNRLSELTNMDNKPVALNGGLSELSNFTAKLESFDDFVDDKIRSINSSTNSINNLTEQVSKIDVLCTQINSKLESTNIQNTRPLPSLPLSQMIIPLTSIIIMHLIQKHVSFWVIAILSTLS